MVGTAGLLAADGSESILRSEFISESPFVDSVHASTIAETEHGLVAAWFGGTREGAIDVSIWMTREQGGVWSDPAEVANGYEPKEKRRFPCWNPVLFNTRDGDLLLFYRVGPSPSRWWSYVRRSEDGGETWVQMYRLPSGYLGPIKNPPVELPSGTLLCGSSTEDSGWRVQMEWTTDPFKRWFKTEPLNRAMVIPAIQPAIIMHSTNDLQVLCRTKRGYIAESWSRDGGVSWEQLKRTALPNPNSGLDATKLADGRSLLVYNHAERGRHLLNVAVSRDGEEWQAAAVLENEAGAEFSYPTVIQTSDGLVHITYTWKREKVKHVVLNPTGLGGPRMTDGVWPE
jgi:predicted neuraminidase